jgi:hypothetical protein
MTSAVLQWITQELTWSRTTLSRSSEKYLHRFWPPELVHIIAQYTETHILEFSARFGIMCAVFAFIEEKPITDMDIMDGSKVAYPDLYEKETEPFDAIRNNMLRFYHSKLSS